MNAPFAVGVILMAMLAAGCATSRPPVEIAVPPPNAPASTERKIDEYRWRPRGNRQCLPATWNAARGRTAGPVCRSPQLRAGIAGLRLSARARPFCVVLLRHRRRARRVRERGCGRSVRSHQAGSARRSRARALAPVSIQRWNPGRVRAVVERGVRRLGVLPRHRASRPCVVRLAARQTF